MDRKVILLFGGDSEERFVSIASAQSMAQAISVAKLWFWHKEGQIFDVDYQQLVNHDNPFTNELIPTSNPIFNTIKDAIKSDLSDNHVFLLGVHGGQGENGDVQSLLEEFHRPYTGSNAKASRLAFDKVATKECLKGFHIDMAPHIVIETTAEKHSIKKMLKEFFSEYGQAIVKPVCGGSSIGCFFVRDEKDIDSVTDKLATFRPKPFLAEKLINGREITVGVIESDDGLIGLPCTEIMLDENRNFDYVGKYLGMGTKEITPAKLSLPLAGEPQRVAIAAHTALSLYGYSRTDMILKDDVFYFLEINTLPGLSKQSLVPQQLAAAGITMREFLTAQIKLATSRGFSMPGFKLYD